MLRWIVATCLQARVVVIVLAAAMMFFGGRALRDAPVDTLPEFGPTTVQIQAEALGLSATEVEQLVTVPLEQDLLSFVPWVDVIRSESIPGLASIELIFEPGTDLYQARQAVQERLSEAAVALPGASKVPMMIEPSSSTNRVMMVQLSSDKLSLIEMSVLARWTIKPRILGVEGVANVAIWGQREQQLQVQVDPARLRERDVSLLQVVETTGNALWWSPLGFVEASSPGTGGFIDTPNQRLTIQHLSPITSPEALAKVPLQDTPNVRIGDVADVVEGHQLLIGDAVSNRAPGLLMVVEKYPYADTLATTHGVEKELDALAPGLSGIEIDPTIYRPATTIESGIDALTVAAIIGLVLVILLLGAVFVDWRAAVIAAVVLPLSLIMAGTALYLGGATFNVMVLAGLAIAVAMLVDDVIIDVANVRRRRAERNGEPIPSTIVDAIIEMRGSVVFAALIVGLSVLPLFVLSGTAGEFFPSLAVAYVAAVAAALLVSLTVTPALAMFLLEGAPTSRDGALPARWLSRAYGSAFRRFARVPGAPYAALIILALVGLSAGTQLSRPSVLPEFEQRDLLIHWDGPPGTSEPEISRIVNAAAAELRTVSGVRNVGAHVGRAVTSDRIVGSNSAEIWVSIDEGADYDATLARIRETVDGYPGLSREVVTYEAERVSQLVPGTERDLTVRLYGENQDLLGTEAEKLRQAILGVDGVAEPRVEFPPEEPTIEIEVDLAAAERFGVNPGDVRRTAATLLSSLFVGALFEEQKVFEVVVWSTPATRANLTSVRNLPIGTASGSEVRLEDVADIRVAAVPSVIKREAISRYIDITADVAGRDRGAVAHDIEGVLRSATLPREFHAEVLDGTQVGEGRDDRVLPVAIAAAVGIFLLLQMAFGSWRLAAVVFVTAPAALAGGALAALADGGELTIGSYAGFFALMAIVARQSIVLVRHYQRLQQEEGSRPAGDLMLRASEERVVPVIMSALAVALALVPALFIDDVFGHELVTPLARILLGGLVTSTLFTLFVTPHLAARFAPAAEAAASQWQLDTGRVRVEAGEPGS